MGLITRPLLEAVGYKWHYSLLVVQSKNDYDDLFLINVFQSQITVMDFPVFKSIQPDVSCSQLLALIIKLMLSAASA